MLYEFSDKEKVIMHPYYKLNQQIEKRFNLSELKDLCFMLGLEYENLQGNTRKDKIRELIKHCMRHDLMRDLIQHLNKLRPGIKWGSISSSASSSPPESKTKSSTTPLSDNMTKIIVAIIAFIPIFTGAYWQYVWKPSQQPPTKIATQQIEYVGRVWDNINQMPVGEAKITFELQGTSPYIIYTDSEGVYRFSINVQSNNNLNGRIRIEAVGYEIYNRNITLYLESTTIEDIRLFPLEETGSQSSQINAEQTMVAATATQAQINFDGTITALASMADQAAAAATAVQAQADFDGTVSAIENRDSDGDTFPDIQDAFPNNKNEWFDSDRDGRGDNSDAFPYDPAYQDPFTATPSPTLTSVAPTATPTQVANHQFDWLGDNLDNTAFYNTGSVIFTLNGNGLAMTGRRVSDRVWIDRSLPENFKLTVAFKTFDPECRLYVGLGDGINWAPSYLLQISDARIGFHKYLGEFVSDFEYAFIDNFGEYIKAGQTTVVTFERNNSVIRAYFNQNLLFSIPSGIDSEMTQINQYNMLFFNPNRQNSGSTGIGCSDMIVEGFSLEILE